MPDPLLNKEEFILQYIDGELSEEDRLFVQAQIEKDVAWNRIAEGLLTAVNSVRYYGIASEVAAIHQQLVQDNMLPKVYKTKTISFKRIIRLTTAVAASILLLFAGIKGYEFYNLSPEKVYAETFVMYQPSISRGVAEEKTSAIKQAYSVKDYKKVIQEAGKAGTINEDAFLAGLASLQLNDAPDAINRLKPVAENSNTFQPDAQFYLALAYLKNKDYDRTINLMQKIKADQMHPYHLQFSSKTIREVKMLKWK